MQSDGMRRTRGARPSKRLVGGWTDNRPAKRWTRLTPALDVAVHALCMVERRTPSEMLALLIEEGLKSRGIDAPPPVRTVSAAPVR